MSGYVYLIRMGETDYYKVGVSRRDITERLEELQTANPIELTLIAYYEQNNPYEVEQNIHRALSTLRVRLEWFKAELAFIQQIFHDHNTMAFVDTFLEEPSSPPVLEEVSLSIDTIPLDNVYSIQDGVPITDEAIKALYQSGWSKNKLAAMLTGGKQARLARIDRAVNG